MNEFDTTNGIADFGSQDEFLDIGHAYVASGKGRSAQIGGAQAHLFDAGDLLQFAVEWMERNYRPDAG